MWGAYNKIKNKIKHYKSSKIIDIRIWHLNLAPVDIIDSLNSNVLKFKPKVLWGMHYLQQVIALSRMIFGNFAIVMHIMFYLLLLKNELMITNSIPYKWKLASWILGNFFLIRQIISYMLPLSILYIFWKSK